MNNKRWMALVIAGVLGLVSMLLALPGNKTKTDVENNLTQNGLFETTITSGIDKQKIVVLEIDGAIMSGTGNVGIFSEEGYNHEFFLQQLEAIKDDSSVKGVLLEINTPGGGVYESAEIARGITAFQEEQKIPFYVAMKNMAASGGYYVAASADKIFANEETMTGSIGVIMSGLNVSGLLDKLGVADETVKSGELKDIGSSTRKWTEKDRQVLQEMIDSSYERFVDIVATGRNMPKDKVKEIADGRIYDGVQAMQNGLVDQIGFPDEALAALISDNQLSQARVIKYEQDEPLFSNPILDKLLNSKAKKLFAARLDEASVIGKLVENFGTSDAPRMMYLYGGE